MSFEKSEVLFQSWSPPVDFKVESSGKIVGYCVRTNKSNTYTTLGQLVAARLVFSDVILVAPLPFLKKVMRIGRGIPGLSVIGYATIVDGSVNFIKQPTAESYYFKGELNKKTEKAGTNARVTENDLKILGFFENETILVTTLSKKLGITINNSYNKLRRLKRMGVVEEVGDSYPKAYKIIGKRSVGEKIAPG